MPSQRLVAVKTFGENIESELSEVKILQQLKHARIVDFIGICNGNDMFVIIYSYYFHTSFNLYFIGVCVTASLLRFLGLF